MRRRGFSLSEILLAFAIMIVGVVSVATFVATVYRSVKEGKQQSIASTCAQREIEALRDNNVSLTRLLYHPTEGTKSETVTVDDRQIRFDTEVRVTENAGLGGRYLDVSARVRWDQSGRSRQVELKTCYPAPRIITSPTPHV